MLPPICDCSGAPGSGANIRPLSRTSCLQAAGRHAGLDVDPPELGLERADPVEPVEREHDAAVRAPRPPRAPGPAAARDDRHVALVAPREHGGDLLGAPRQHDRVGPAGQRA